ncbi:MAG: hypothetical protein AAGE01_24425 [Pseudomonadota bacterium]
MDLATIESHQSDRSLTLAARFRQQVASLPVSNVFNPSFHVDDRAAVLAFRAIVDGEQELAAFVAVDDELIRLDGLTPPVAVPRLIDPKVFALDDRVFITFHSGVVSPRNQVFVMEVHPRVGPIREVIYSRRRPQERNWAFFSKGGDIHAVYWLNPLMVLKLVRETENAWVMARAWAPRLDPHLPENLTLGTPLAGHPDGFRFVGHGKTMVDGKKIYQGRAGLFDFERRAITLDDEWLVHSLASMAGSPIKHNTHLHSCTYFSGIQVVGGETVVGYGVNDVDYGFASLRPSARGAAPSVKSRGGSEAPALPLEVGEPSPGRAASEPR